LKNKEDLLDAREFSKLLPLLSNGSNIGQNFELSPISARIELACSEAAPSKQGRSSPKCKHAIRFSRKESTTCVLAFFEELAQVTVRSSDQNGRH